MISVNISKTEGLIPIHFVVGVVLAFLIIFAGVNIIKLGEAFGQNIWSGRDGGIDVESSAFGEALLCAHLKCIGGCDEVISSDWEWASLEYKGEPGCPCDDSWDTNKNGRICSDDSKSHPIKVTLNEPVTVHDYWWREIACEGGCSGVNLYSVKNCQPSTAQYKALTNSISFSTDQGIDCNTGRSQCTVPAGIWYIWAETYMGGPNSEIMVCKDRPDTIPTCESECDARLIYGDKGGECVASGSGPKCESGTCTYDENIGDIYCTLPNQECYCKGEDACDCGTSGTQQCTEHGCVNIVEKNYACCQNLREEWTVWHEESICDMAGTRIAPSNCDSTTSDDNTACDNYCKSLGWNEGEYRGNLCLCKRSECEAYNTARVCNMIEGCRWCDKCFNFLTLDSDPGTSNIFEDDHHNKCIEDSEFCGNYVCKENECGATCGDDADCDIGQACPSYTCQCEETICCTFYGTTESQCIPSSQCVGGSSRGDSCSGVLGECEGM